MNKYYHIATYGCQMNVHDSEKIAGILEQKGYKASKIEDADIIVFNTCCIRETAEKKIFGNIGDIKRLKKQNPSIIVAVVGCMSQQQGMQELLKKRFPFIDIIMGTTNYHKISQAIDHVLLIKHYYGSVVYEEKPEIIEDVPIYRTSGVNAWVNIMYGCNNFCAYCIVPYVRGRERSREPQKVLDEIKSLLDKDYKEITLLGQNVNSYCNDMDNGWSFARLLENIAKIKGKFRLRFMTSHPKDFNKEIVDIIASSPNICNHIHLPVQSGSNRILKLMNRKYTREHYLEIIDHIKTIPGVGITSDIMVGFPTETDQDFEDTLSLVKQVRYSNAFTFVYSPRKGTPAAEMEQIPASIKKQRITKLVALQNKITREISQEYIGLTKEVLVEDINPKFENTLCGRTESGRLVNFEGNKSLIGQFVDIKILKAKSASLWGERQ
ncbi:MAG: tRNA (N6-isopentenyl adenosine(37)-C2)-methylthiotransferase MiaB [Christensenellales bacterium]|jgi:tRNA-2-methylthio-N6-dimethylallyladenosine synthase|nr:tRNA (N6-isopentenyl adenosine(37)-C2)-methylthiotransferase MiaB [Clostridiales bacterium]